MKGLDGREHASLRQRLVALALLGLALFLPPLVFLAGGEIGGVPGGFLYLFAVWAGLIGLAAWIVEGA